MLNRSRAEATGRISIISLLKKWFWKSSISYAFCMAPWSGFIKRWLKCKSSTLWKRTWSTWSLVLSLPMTTCLTSSWALAGFAPKMKKCSSLWNLLSFKKWQRRQSAWANGSPWTKAVKSVSASKSNSVRPWTPAGTWEAAIWLWKSTPRYLSAAKPASRS